MIELSLRKKLKSSYGDILLEIKAHVEKGSIVTFYGKSGAGKTSIFRMLAGLLSPEEGKIIVNGSTWVDTKKGIDIPPQKRRVGFVFQDYALFPNMTVRENLLFALERGQDKKIVGDLIDTIELGTLQDRKPETLSGGQKQRVALARALAQKPELLLLDEALAALDVEMRTKLQHHILEVHRAYGLTTLLVSHDFSEIIKMSDRMLVIDEGKVIRQGKPAEVLTHKRVSAKFQFTGEIIDIEKQDIVFIISILIGKDLVKVVAEESEVNTLHIGDKVMIASKAFNPIIKKIE